MSGVWRPFPYKRTARTVWPVNKVQSGNKSNLPAFVHTVAPAGLTRPLPWLCCVSTRRLDGIFSASRGTRRYVSLSLSLWVCVHWLKHWTDFSFCTGVRGGNSDYRVRPDYSKFLHFIVSSPQGRFTHCEAGLKRLEVEPTPPIGNRCQSNQEDLCSLSCLELFMRRCFSHFGTNF